ncbi:VRR-NUC domain-containing protein [Kushneria aurantia]|uniref:phosphodiesterase I n=1 Tax=Kushneria aurantia TaxID=504092 RepID=A0ABV6G1Q0_9GAMM|nr:VRR-NUC domain-containing protein [Kushneria aurantia]
MNSASPAAESALAIADSRRDPLYYLANFETVLRWVGQRYDDLLDSDERTFIDAFFALPTASRALLVRMVMRKGEYFRRAALDYAEIGDSGAALAPLIDAGLVEAAPLLGIETLAALLKRAELAALFADVVAPGLRKRELQARLAERFDTPRTPPHWQTAAGRVLPDEIVALSVMPLCERLRLMFFGNLRQHFSEFVLADLGHYRFETVPFTPDSRAFRCRADLERYEQLHRLRERFDAGEELATLIAELPAPFTDSHWLDTRRSRLVYAIARHCERCGELARAAQLYDDSRHHEARARRVRCLERLECFEAALELAQQGESEPGSEAERQQLARVIPRLRRRLGLARLPPAAAAEPVRLDLTLPRVASVERALCDHLDSAEAPVRYVENSLINALFGLLCWEAIFAPLPGAFFHPFQSGPADLLRTAFHARRETLFARCLAQLESGDYRATICHHFVAKQGLQNPFVAWPVLDDALLALALDCLPPAHLRLWFERLLGDIRANRAGMPDLIRFYPQRETAARYEMIEVKGPGDRLQDNQRRWIDFCARHAMPVTVCYVRWAEKASP